MTLNPIGRDLVPLQGFKPTPAKTEPKSAFARDLKLTPIDKLEKTFGAAAINNVFKLPVRFSFSLDGVPKTPLPRITEAETQSMLKTLQPGDIIISGDHGGFIHGSVYLGNNEVVQALAGEKLQRPRNRTDKVVAKMQGALAHAPLPARAKAVIGDLVQAIPRTKSGGVGVIRESWSGYLARSERDNAIVLRPQHVDAHDIAQIKQYALAQVGKDYDYAFATYDDSRMYCTELVAKSLGAADHGPRVEGHMFSVMGLKREAITPEDFLKNSNLKPVWQSNHYGETSFGKAHPLTIAK